LNETVKVLTSKKLVDDTVAKPSRLEIDALVDQLRRDGIVMLPQLVDSTQLSDMQHAFKARLGRMRLNNLDGYEKERYRHVVQDALVVAQGFVDIGIHPVVKQVLQRYLGDSFALVEAKGWRSLPTRRDFHGWHGDAWYDETSANGMPLEVKLAFYLTDVESGAFNYIKGSHRKEHPRVVSNREVQGIPTSNIAAMTGPAGTAFLFDTSGIHRQSVPILEAREAVFYNYHDPGVRLQKEIVDYYRYHPLILNAAFLGELSKEDERILGFGNKLRYQLTPERLDEYPTLHKAMTFGYGVTLVARDLRERIGTRLRRILSRSSKKTRSL
jgi:Phytanoyl-CoA dioxygenase (PhyH)